MDSEKRVVKQSKGLLVDGLRPANNYNLRVYAENKLGKSEASPFTTHGTLEAGKLWAQWSCCLKYKSLRVFKLKLLKDLST